MGGCECAACVVCDLLTATVPEFKHSIIASAYSGATPLRLATGATPRLITPPRTLTALMHYYAIRLIWAALIQTFSERPMNQS